MNKKIAVGIEIAKILFQICLLSIVYYATIGADCNFDDMKVIGQFFLITLGVILLSGIILDILINIVVSFFIKLEKPMVGEWEKYINKNIVVNFAYALSTVSIGFMIILALGLPIEFVLLTIQIGFVILMVIVNATKVYYYYE